MTPPLEARGLGKRFRRDWGLRDCTLTIPEGAIVGLTGPNAAGKSTLLALATGLLAPTEGVIEVLGADPMREPSILARSGATRCQTAPHRRCPGPAAHSPCWDAPVPWRPSRSTSAGRRPRSSSR